MTVGSRATVDPLPKGLCRDGAPFSSRMAGKACWKWTRPTSLAGGEAEKEDAVIDEG